MFISNLRLEQHIGAWRPDLGLPRSKSFWKKSRDFGYRS